MSYELEELSVDNVNFYVKVNSLAWKQTYKGIVDDYFLELINTKEEINKSIERMKNNINKPLYKAFLLKVNDKYVGMFRVCKTDKDMGELKSLYLLDEVKHKGYGKILFKRALEEVKKMGFNSMIVGCLSDNTNANNFYKHMGGVFVSNRDFTILNQTLKENVYLFREI